MEMMTEKMIHHAWCCSPVLTAPKLGKRSYLTFSKAISTEACGSSGVCDVANRLYISSES
jgi:hypothetical protein